MAKRYVKKLKKLMRQGDALVYYKNEIYVSRGHKAKIKTDTILLAKYNFDKNLYILKPISAKSILDILYIKEENN